MRATRPLFRLDPGWLFILAGLVVCAAGVLLPAQADLRALGEQLAQLQAEEARAYQRLAAHADFIDQVERGEPAMIRRLATAQLNLVPEGDKPILLASADASPVTQWIDATVDLDIRPSPPAGLSTLSRWASGPSRLWLFGGGILVVFVGLLISPDPPRRGKRAEAKRDASIRAAETWREDSLAHSALPRTTEGDTDDHDGTLRSALRIADDLDDSPAIQHEMDDALPSADTVDLEEDELLSVARIVVEEDAHEIEQEREHAAEVIVHAKEIALQLRDAGTTSFQPSRAHVASCEGVSGEESRMLLEQSCLDDAAAVAEPVIGEQTATIDEAPAREKPSRQRRPAHRRSAPQEEPTTAADDDQTLDALTAPLANDGPAPAANAKTRRSPSDGGHLDDEEASDIPFLRHRRGASSNDAESDTDDDMDAHGDVSSFEAGISTDPEIDTDGQDAGIVDDHHDGAKSKRRKQ